MSNDIEFKLGDMDALGLTEFDPAEHLTSPEAIAAYMTEIAATGNPELLQLAMKDVARAYGMGKVAEKANITREGAYKALRRGSKPRLETIMAMLDAIGLQIAIVPKAANDTPAV